MAVKGIIIKPEFEEHSPGNIFYINFILRIGFFQKGFNKLGNNPKDCILFVSSKAAQEAIAGLKEGTHLGHIGILVDAAEKTVYTDSFYPLESPAARELRKKGIASFAELQIERQLEKWYPDFHITHSSNPLKRRRRQLKKRGRRIGERLQLKAAPMLTREYVKKGIRKYNQSRRRRR